VDQTANAPDRIAAELAADLDAGFAALFAAYQNVLFSTALRICGRWADAEDLTAAAGTRYLASDTTGVVCFPSCRNARRITPAHRHGFASLTAAGRAGFRPCLHCQPA